MARKIFPAAEITRDTSSPSLPVTDRITLGG
jgi:hypothetical protein